MRHSSSLDRESFQQLLASAFAVQESQMDSQFLSSIMEVQRLVTRGELGVDGAMLLVVESAREVADAAGVAIGLLQGDQLTYQAGSGCSRAQVGTRVTASLTVSANGRTSREILRVENAHTDTRIEGAICRQFGAQSLLILPIYEEKALAGVFEILFSEAHTFGEREVRTYQLMASLIEAAMQQAFESRKRQELASESKNAVPIAAQSGEFLKDYREWQSRRHAIYQRCGLALAAVRESAVRRSAWLAKMTAQGVKEFTSSDGHRKLVSAAAVAGFGLTLTLVVAYSSRRPASPLGTSEGPRITAPEQQEPFQATPAEATLKGEPGILPVESARPASTRVRRVRMGATGVEHFGDDVTVRHFSYKPAPPRRTAGASRVSYIGEDVTVRYFSPRPEAKPESQ